MKLIEKLPRCFYESVGVGVETHTPSWTTYIYHYPSHPCTLSTVRNGCETVNEIVYHHISFFDCEKTARLAHTELNLSKRRFFTEKFSEVLLLDPTRRATKIVCGKADCKDLLFFMDR